MKTRNQDPQAKDKQKEKDETSRENFWDSRCKNEPGYQGCKIYEV